MWSNIFFCNDIISKGNKMKIEAFSRSDAEQIINLLGGLGEAKKAANMARIMRTMSVCYKGCDGVKGQFWLNEVDEAIRIKEIDLNE